MNSNVHTGFNSVDASEHTQYPIEYEFNIEYRRTENNEITEFSFSGFNFSNNQLQLLMSHVGRDSFNEWLRVCLSEDPTDTTSLPTLRIRGFPDNAVRLRSINTRQESDENDEWINDEDFLEELEAMEDE